MKKVLAFVLALTMALSLAACGGSSSSGSSSDAAASDSGSADKVYKLKISLEPSESNFMAENWREWAQAVTEKSGGRLDFQFYYDNTLVDPNAQYQQLVAGIADICDVHRYASDGFVISENWKLLTAGIPADQQVSLSYQFLDEFPQVADEFKDVKILAHTYSGGGAYDLLTVKKAVNSPADMAGMTIWCEADWNDFILACGATPVNTPFSEVYSSLQKNMYDGLMIAAETLQSCNFAEVCKYITMIDFCYMSGPGHLMNMNTWNSLPEDLQAIITDPELIAKLEAANHDDGFNLEASSIAWAKEKYGTTVVEPTDEARQQFLDLLTQAKGTLAKKLDDQGLPGTEMVATVAEWSAQ